MTIFLYTGDGGGKTTNALGIALRALGHGQQVMMIQFMKWWKQTGEFKFQELHKRDFEIVQVGREGWWRKDDLNDEDKQIMTKFVETFIEEFSVYSQEPPTETRRSMNMQRGTFLPHILILDEICLAVGWELLKISQVKDMLNAIPNYITVVMTGRHAPQELIDLADVAVEVNMLKEPEKMICIKGVNW